MLILYVAMKHDYGDPAAGLSAEHGFAFQPLHGMGHDILYFDFMGLLQRYGRGGMNRRLREVAKAEKPRVMWTVLYQDQLDRRVVREISEGGVTTTFNWFADDHWRFEIFSRYWAPCFNWVATTARAAVAKYERMGSRNVIASQWAVNPFVYRKPADGGKEVGGHEVTFVGQPYGRRRKLIERLQAAGVQVRAWGRGWEQGRLPETEMVRVFGGSRINLNFAGSSMPQPGRGRQVEAWATDRLLRVPGGWGLKRAVGSCRTAWGRVRGSGGELAGEDGGAAGAVSAQIKARVFEVPGSGGFLLTEPADDLGSYYRTGQEVACFTDEADLLEKVRYYLAHESERAAIADAGYRRTHHEHTYLHRYTEILQRMGCEVEAVGEVSRWLARRPGGVEEIT